MLDKVLMGYYFFALGTKTHGSSSGGLSWLLCIRLGLSRLLCDSLLLLGGSLLDNFLLLRSSSLLCGGFLGGSLLGGFLGSSLLRIKLDYIGHDKLSVRKNLPWGCPWRQA